MRPRNPQVANRAKAQPLAPDSVEARNAVYARSEERAAKEEYEKKLELEKEEQLHVWKEFWASLNDGSGTQNSRLGGLTEHTFLPEDKSLSAVDAATIRETEEDEQERRMYRIEKRALKYDIAKEKMETGAFKGKEITWDFAKACWKKGYVFTVKGKHNCLTEKCKLRRLEPGAVHLDYQVVPPARFSATGDVWMCPFNASVHLCGAIHRCGSKMLTAQGGAVCQLTGTYFGQTLNGAMDGRVSAQDVWAQEEKPRKGRGRHKKRVHSTYAGTFNGPGAVNGLQAAAAAANAAASSVLESKEERVNRILDSDHARQEELETVRCTPGGAMERAVYERDRYRTLDTPEERERKMRKKTERGGFVPLAIASAVDGGQPVKEMEDTTGPSQNTVAAKPLFETKPVASSSLRELLKDSFITLANRPDQLMDNSSGQMGKSRLLEQRQREGSQADSRDATDQQIVAPARSARTCEQTESQPSFTATAKPPSAIFGSDTFDPFMRPALQLSARALHAAVNTTIVNSSQAELTTRLCRHVFYNRRIKDIAYRRYEDAWKHAEIECKRLVAPFVSTAIAMKFEAPSNGERHGTTSEASGEEPEKMKVVQGSEEDDDDDDDDFVDWANTEREGGVSYGSMAKKKQADEGIVGNLRKPVMPQEIMAVVGAAVAAALETKDLVDKPDFFRQDPAIVEYFSLAVMRVFQVIGLTPGAQAIRNARPATINLRKVAPVILYRLRDGVADDVYVDPRTGIVQTCKNIHTLLREHLRVTKECQRDNFRAQTNANADIGALVPTAVPCRTTGLQQSAFSFVLAKTDMGRTYSNEQASSDVPRSRTNAKAVLDVKKQARYGSFLERFDENGEIPAGTLVRGGDEGGDDSVSQKTTSGMPSETGETQRWLEEEISRRGYVCARIVFVPPHPFLRRLVRESDFAELEADFVDDKVMEGTKIVGDCYRSLLLGNHTMTQLEKFCLHNLMKVEDHTE